MTAATSACTFGLARAAAVKAIAMLAANLASGDAGDRAAAARYLDAAERIQDAQTEGEIVAAIAAADRAEP